MRLTLAVLRALLMSDNLDYVSLWWIARCASILSRTRMRSAFGEALDLVAAIRPAEADTAAHHPGARAYLAASERGPHAN